MNYLATAKAISALKIQGAQQIALFGAKALLSCKNKREISHAVKILSASRPTEPCLRNALAYATSGGNLPEMVARAEAYFRDGERQIAKYGSRRIKQGNVVFTHCHSEAVMSILLEAKRQRKAFSVHNTETRPFFQGRLTAKELAASGIEVTHFVDSAARLALKGADIMLIGCDAVTAEGFVVNKIGSEMFAEIANAYEIPVYVCTLSWKFDGRTRFGYEEALESRFSREVWRNPPKGVSISNVVFEKIHPRLITGVISELGITTVEGFLEEVKSAYPWIS